MIASDEDSQIDASRKRKRDDDSGYAKVMVDDEGRYDLGASDCTSRKVQRNSIDFDHKRRLDDRQLGDRSRKRQSQEARKSFACPFFKRDPLRGKCAKLCAGPGWPNTHRVKEHLYSHHRAPLFCFRCGEQFSSDKGLESHFRRESACPLRVVSPRVGFESRYFNNRQEQELKSKKRLHMKSEEEKWYHLYGILFPDDDPSMHPSPYYDSGQDLSSFTEHLASRLPDAVVARLSQTLSTKEVNKVRKAVEEALTSLLPRGLVNAESQSTTPAMVETENGLDSSISAIDVCDTGLGLGSWNGLPEEWIATATNAADFLGVENADIQQGWASAFQAPGEAIETYAECDAWSRANSAP